MAEESEILSAEIDIETFRALENISNFTVAMNNATGALNKSDDAIKRNEASLQNINPWILKYGENAVREFTKAQQAAEKAAQATQREHEKAYQAIQRSQERTAREAERAAEQVTRANSQWQNSVSGIVSSYLGFQTVFKVLDELDDRQRRILEGREKLVQGRLSLDQQLRSAAFNIFGTVNQGTIDQTRSLVQTLTGQAPGSTIEQAAAVAGAGASFNLNPAQPGADRDTLRELLQYGARANLEPETTGDLVRLLAATKNLNPQGARSLLAQLETAAQRSPVEKQAAFVPYGLRAALPLINQGLGLQEAFGLFSATAANEVSPRVASSSVEAFAGVFRGDDDKGAAALFQQAVSAGLIDPRQFSALQGRVMKAIAPNYQSRINNLQSNITDASSDLDRAQHDFDRDSAEIRRRMQEAEAKGKQTDSLAVQLDRRRETFETRQRELNEQITRARQSLDDINRTEGAKIAGQFGSAAWRALPLAQRYEVFRALAQRAQSPEELTEFLTGAGAQGQALRAGTNILSPGGVLAQQTTAEAMAAARPQEVEQRNRDFASTNVAQNIATEQRIRFNEAAAVGKPEELNRILIQEAASRATQIQQAGQRPSILTEDAFQLRVFVDSLYRQVLQFYNGMSREEQARYPEIRVILDDLQQTIQSGGVRGTAGTATNFGLISKARASAESLSLRYFNLMRSIVNGRNNNPNATRTPGETVNIPLGEEFQRGGQGTPIPPIGAPANNFAPIDVVGSPNGRALGTPSGPRADAGINYNVSIGTIVSGGGDVLDTVGRIAASENA